MSNELILYEVDRTVGRVTLNRPDKLNSFSQEMAASLQEVLATAGEDGSVRALYLTGAGRAFCAGQDLAEASPSGDDPGPDLSAIVRRSYNPVIRRLRALEKPVVCAVNGVAAGAGANLALSCDIVLAGKSVSFIQSFCQIGLVPDTGGTFFLPRLVGLSRASELAMLGEKVSAERAEEIGMIYRACSDEELEEQAFGLALKLAGRPTRGLGLIKRALNASLTNDLDEQLELEAKLQGKAGATNDYKEGIAAFLEKRKPKFTGT